VIVLNDRRMMAMIMTIWKDDNVQWSSGDGIRSGTCVF